ncbi:MAG: adenosylcobinamide-phosphate synthase CbiB [Planctomycetota bacterium]
MFLVAVIIDSALGELPSRIHPVVWMGRAISFFSRRLPRDGVAALLCGALLAVGLIAAFVSATTLLLESLVRVGQWPRFVAEVLVLQSTFSVALLLDEVRRTASVLASGDLTLARRELHHLCSRDPSDLDQEEVGSAALSSLFENSVDSFLAPWMFWIVLGVPGAVGYRVLNTLDAMVGYRGEFERLGKASARLDDLANWIPARLSVPVLATAGSLRSLPWKSALATVKRDRGRTPSPNGGIPMAMGAGLLSVRLVKPGAYVLNAGGRAVLPQDLLRGCQVVGAAAWLGAVATLLAALCCRELP